MDEYQTHAQAAQQGDVVEQAAQGALGLNGPGNLKHEGRAPVQVDVGGGVAKPPYASLRTFTHRRYPSFATLDSPPLIRLARPPFYPNTPRSV